MRRNPTTLFETDVEVVGNFFGEPTTDITRSLNSQTPLRNEVDGKLYFRLSWLSEYLRNRGKSYAQVNAVLNRVKTAGLERGILDSVDENEVPPINDWGAIRPVTEIHEETYGTRVMMVTFQEAERKMAKLKKLYPIDLDEEGKLDFKAVQKKHQYLIPTEEDYAIHTTKVIILGAELTAEPAPPVTGDTSRWLIRGRQPNYNAYAEAVTRCDEDESVIYPIHSDPSVNYQQIYLRAALGRVSPLTQVSMERYGDDYIRLRRK